MPRPLILQLQVSMDMYMATSENTLSFLGTPWSEDIRGYIRALMTPVDHILLGRKLASGFIPHWRSRPAHEDAATVDKFAACRKTVFSRTLSAPDPSWIDDEPNVEVVHDLAAVWRLKQADGGTLISYGGVQFAHELLRVDGLVDAVILVVNPTALGHGQRVFPTPGNWRLREARRFACGLAVLRWQNGDA